MQTHPQPVDIVMAGTFAAWRLGTLQARALPIARSLQERGIRCAIVTTPWDMPSEAGVVDSIAGISLYNTESTGVTSPIPAIAQQTSQIRALRPRLVHVFKPKGYGGFAGQAVSSRLPVVIDSDDWEGDGGWNQIGGYGRLQQRVFNWQERTLLRSARAVSAASQLLAHRAIVLRDAPENTVQWVPNGLDQQWATRLAAARTTPACTSSNVPTIVLYSRFAEFPSDWLPRFLATLSDSIDDGRCAKVMIIGESAPIGAGYDSLDIDQMGYVALDRIPGLLGRANAAIYPYADSLVSRSKNSVKLLELMASGCAIVASQVGDIPAVLGESGMQVPSADPETFAAATTALLRKPSVIQEYGRLAQERVAHHFTIDATTSRLVDLYRRTGLLTR